FGAVPDEAAVEVAALEEVAAVLDGHDRRELQRLVELACAHVREADVDDLALVLEAHQLADRVGERHRAVDRVQVVEPDGAAEVARAALAALAEPLRARVDFPTAAGPRE